MVTNLDVNIGFEVPEQCLKNKIFEEYFSFSKGL